MIQYFRCAIYFLIPELIFRFAHAFNISLDASCKEHADWITMWKISRIRHLVPIEIKLRVKFSTRRSCHQFSCLLLKHLIGCPILWPWYESFRYLVILSQIIRMRFNKWCIYQLEWSRVSRNEQKCHSVGILNNEPVTRLAPVTLFVNMSYIDFE